MRALVDDSLGNRVRTCTIDGCDRQHNARGLCTAHYERWSKYGDALAGEPVIDKFNHSARFWTKVDKTETCWLWTPPLDDSGYGKFSVSGKKVGAHRWAYEEINGAIPDGLQIDHLCRVRNCVRPDHLEAVTHLENVRRSVPFRRGRKVAA